jgi:hypothetical protein
VAATNSLNKVYLSDSKHSVSDSVGSVTMHASRSPDDTTLYYIFSQHVVSE